MQDKNVAVASQRIMQEGADTEQPKAEAARTDVMTEFAPENRTQSIGLAQESRDEVAQQVEDMRSKTGEFHRS
jgi:hypothetical protein